MVGMHEAPRGERERKRWLRRRLVGEQAGHITAELPDEKPKPRPGDICPACGFTVPKDIEEFLAVLDPPPDDELVELGSQSIVEAISEDDEFPNVLM